MATEDNPIHVENDDELTRHIAEFHVERDRAALVSGTKENDTLKGTQDKAWEESKYHLPEGVTLLEFFRRRRTRERPKRGK